MICNIINFKELQEFISTDDVEYCHSARENKRLVVTFNGNIKVTVAGKTVWEGNQPFLAVEAYNKITDKYYKPNKNFKL